MVKIAVLGYGVVGSGVAEVMSRNAESIARKAGENIEIKYILDIRDFPDSPWADRFVKDFDVILNDDEVFAVVEVMGGSHPAFEYSMAALERGKNVITSNKEVVASYGAQLLKTAKEHDVQYLFEASVGGGIPIIRPLYQCLAANELNAVTGILNGTTNFILTEMIKKGKSFEEALADAQARGYAERDPSADVEGKDTCRKVCILASLAFGRHVYPDSVHTEGITKVTLQDVEYAAAWGGVIKLIGRASKLPDGSVSAMVSPCFIPSDNPLANVEDVFNGILVGGDAIGEVMFYGRGAGKLPTASAVVADVIDAWKHRDTPKILHWVDVEETFVADYKETESRFYVRITAEDREKAMQAARELFGEVSELNRPGASNECAFVTKPIPEGNMEDLLSVLRGKKSVLSVNSVIRILD